MKKSLSLLLALAMVFGLFASVAAAADTTLTTAQKYQWFVDSKILKGDSSGNPRLDDSLTRAEFATIAVAVAGLTPATSGQTFTDVNNKQWFYGAIEAAAKAGLVNGVGLGKFGPKLNVTVEEAIKVAVGVAGLTPVAGATVDGSSAWAGPYIKAAQNAGLAVPSNYKANATRGLTIDLAYAVVQVKAVPTLADVTATANSDDTITVTGKVVGKADSVKVALGTATAVAATLKDDGTFTYTTAKQVAGTYTLSVVAYDSAKASAAVTKSVTIDSFNVVSATVVGGKQIAVKFNKPVQVGVSVGGATYALSNNTNSNVLLNNVAPIAGSVSDDKTTVTYTFAPFALNSYAQLEIKNGYKSATGQSLAAYKSAILLADSTAPTVTGVSYAGTTATVTFSESVPAGNLGTLSINGAVIYPTQSSGIYYTVNNDTSDSLNYVASITLHNLTLGTNYSFYLVGGSDYAGNRFDYNTTINAPTDTVAPTITSLTISGEVIKAKFSEAISNAGSVYNGSNTASAVAGVIDSSDNTVATYTTSGSAWLNNNTFLNTTVAVKGYKDLVGNTGADFSQALTLTKDTVKPTLANAIYDGTGVYINFGKAIALNSSANPVTVKYTNTSTVVSYLNWATTSATVGYDANNNGVTTDSGENFYLKLPVTGLGAGTYVITAPASLVKDASNASLVNDSASVTFTVASGSASGSVTVAITKIAGSNSKLQFVFNNEITQASKVVSNFLINGVALPADTNLYFLNDQKTVIAELPSGTFPVSGSRVVKVINVVDTNGNTMSDTNNATITFNENVAPVAQSVAVATDSQLAVTFSETLQSIGQTASAPTGVSVYLNGSTTATTITSYYVSGSVLYINAAAGTFATTQTIQVKFAGATGLVDLVNNSSADITINK